MPKEQMRAAVLAAALMPVPAAAQPGTATVPAPPATALTPLVVTGTRGLAPSLDVPETVTTIGRRRLARGRRQVNLSESLRSVPGVVAQDRHDYAQDLQISIRGFGSLASFGVQGVRLMLDGLPATMPDGQGQSQIFDLPAIGRIEVLRGPFALAYGNSPGGVIRAYTLSAPGRPTLTARLWRGGFGAQQASAAFGAPLGREAGYRGTVSRFHTDGYRVHSAATREQFYGKVRYAAGPARLTFIANVFHQWAQDPSALTAAQVASDPRQANPRAVLYDARKDVHHAEGGVVADLGLGAHNSMRMSAYYGTRSVMEYLPFTGNSGLSSGGVIDLADHFGGAHGHIAHHGLAGAVPYTLTAGIDYDRENEFRKGYANDFGTAGTMRRDEFDVVDDFDQYLQARFDVAPAWSLETGLRHNLVRFRSRDYYVTATNPNDSGSVAYSRTDPVAGVLYRLAPDLHLYANAGRGFQTPTFYQLAYRPDGSPGLNLALAPAESRNYEAGVKAVIGDAVRIDASVFHIRTSNEIVVANSRNGRTSYRNAASTRRDGMELRMSGDFAYDLHAVLALSYIDARFDGGPDSGKRMPAVPRRTGYASLTWDAPAAGFYTSAEVQYRGRVYVDQGNSASASPYAVFDWWCGFRQHPGRWRIREFLRVDNLFDRRYVGAVVVGDSHGRYYEPAPGRDVSVGVGVRRRF